MIKLGRMGWAGHVERMWQRRMDIGGKARRKETTKDIGEWIILK
jgi:hypothetical protein